MKRVILESPFAGDVEGNIAYAKRCLHDCLIRDEAAIASHLLYTQPGILRDDVPEERLWGIKAGLAWQPVADYSVFYTDRGWSSGMTGALHQCLMKQLPFKLRSLDRPVVLPTTLDEDVEALLKASIDSEF